MLGVAAGGLHLCDVFHVDSNQFASKKCGFIG